MDQNKDTIAIESILVREKELAAARMAEVGLDADGQPLRKRSRPKCGAKTRKRTPCKMRAEAGKRRCRLHGGLSTGPKTQEGRERIAAAQRLRWAKP